MTGRIDNSEETLKLRRSRDTLIIVGSGIILFGVWAAVRLYSMAFLRKSATLAEIREAMPEGSEPASDAMILGVMFVMITIVVAFEIGVRLFVGLSAIAEGRGKRSGKLYIPFVYIFIVLSFCTIIYYLVAMLANEAGDDSFKDVSAASVVVEFTNMVMLIQMAASARRVKKYNKRVRREEAGDAA